MQNFMKLCEVNSIASLFRNWAFPN